MKVVVTLTKVFFSGHSRAGQPTDFSSSVNDGRKIHTCRDNYNYWVGMISSLREAGGTLCIREWTGRPYRSKQGLIKEFTADQIGVSRLEFSKCGSSNAGYKASVDGMPVELYDLAKNDGFGNTKDFTEFLEPLFETHGTDTLTLAIIHFTQFRYGSKENGKNQV